MASNGEGASFHRPPSFNGEEYAYWKTRMRIFILAVDFELWEVIENGPHIPQHLIGDEVMNKPRSLWTDAEKKQVQLDFKAMNILTSALGRDEFFRISQCKTSKEIWDTLEVTHEGTSEVKRARLNTLLREYELFTMKPNEPIDEVQKRFTHIVNHLGDLGKSLTNDEVTNKVLRCLDRSWQPKVTAITEAKDLSKMSIATLFGKLKEHEMELGRLAKTEEVDRKMKGLALKASSSKSKKVESSDDESSSDSNDDQMNLLAKKFDKLMKKRNFKRFQSKKKFIKPSASEPQSEKVICYECGKSGHYRNNCPEAKEPEKRSKRFSKKKAYVAWDNPSDSSSSSDSDIQANICLIASDDLSDSEVSIPISEDAMSYNELLEYCVELNHESKFRTKLLDETLEDLESRKKQIAEMSLQIDFLKGENEKLKHAFSRFDMGSKNLNHLLEQQMNHSSRRGIGFDSFDEKPIEQVLTPTNKLVCTHCNMTNHKVQGCLLKARGLPKGKYIWKIKGDLGESSRANTVVPKENWVTKTMAWKNHELSCRLKELRLQEEKGGANHLKGQVFKPSKEH